MKDNFLILKAAAYAAERHKHQKRKGGNKIPYINHPIQVAEMIASNENANTDLLIAALFHDIIEDTVKSENERDAVCKYIKETFGENVLNIVEEVTDDKSLPKQTRKLLQIEHVSHLSDDAKKLKLADKICNLTDILNDPPVDWSQERKYEYFVWAGKVIAGISGINPAMENKVAELLEEGKSRYF